MRVKEITICWFRGAAESTVLDLDSKSCVVFGENGTGKSSFTDAMEYALRGGNLLSLKHEHSGRRHEKGIINTHKPEGANCGFKILFTGEEYLEINIDNSGRPTAQSSSEGDIGDWEYYTTVLRQETVVKFINSTKGDKYSLLLPLLGLEPAQNTAENIRKIKQSLKKDFSLEAQIVQIRSLNEVVAEVFGKKSPGEIWATIEDLFNDYSAKGEKKPKDRKDLCELILSKLTVEREKSSSKQRLFLEFKKISEIDFEIPIQTVRTTNEKLAKSTDVLIEEKLRILRSSSEFSSKHTDEEIECPSCGQEITLKDYQAHVESEIKRLESYQKLFEEKEGAVRKLVELAKNIQEGFNSQEELKSWKEDNQDKEIGKALVYFEKLDLKALETSQVEKTLKELEKHSSILIKKAKKITKEPVPEAEKLHQDLKKAEAGIKFLKAIDLADSLNTKNWVIEFFESLEATLRNEIAITAQKVLDGISEDIGKFWKILNPLKEIEDICLDCPTGDPKGIEILLKFYGLSLPSPRLTLSEGMRNCLGICIFLAMAKQETATDKPIILDDVVISLDREYRGVLLRIFKDEFPERQLVVLTHDREWFVDLKLQLQDSGWVFKTLLPWVGPNTGIQFSSNVSDFSEARAFIEEKPDIAAYKARQILDVILPKYAENLEVKFPFLGGVKNERRGAYEFLVRFASEGKTAFKVKINGEHQVFTQAIEHFKTASTLLQTWANRGAHSPDVTGPEALMLIECCEKTVAYFNCGECGTLVFRMLDQPANRYSCSCGKLRWKA